MKVRVCDICQKNYHNVQIKYKIKAKRLWIFSLFNQKWERIDVCQKCLEKLIEAKEESEDASSTL